MRAKVAIISLLLGSSYADWIDTRIEQELAHFAEKSIQRSDIESAAKGGLGLSRYVEVAHIVIEGGCARAKSFLTTGDYIASQRLERVIRDINRWQKSAHTRPSRKLPDSEFLLSLSSGIEALRHSSFVAADQFGVPVFTFAKKAQTKQLILFPDTYALAQWKKIWRECAEASARFSWKEKIERLFWQGEANDGSYAPKQWSRLPRGRLVLRASQSPDLIEAGFIDMPLFCTKATFDEILHAVGPLKKQLHMRDYFQFKYLFSIEGPSLDWVNTFTLLLSNSLLIKQENAFVQWYSGALKPWVHYVPVREDLSDLEQQVVWARGNDAQARQIAEAGSAFAKAHFDRATSFDYLQRLLLAYNRRLAP